MDLVNQYFKEQIEINNKQQHGKMNLREFYNQFTSKAIKVKEKTLIDSRYEIGRYLEIPINLHLRQI